MPSLIWPIAHQASPRPVHQQAVQDRLHAGQLRGHVLTQALVVAQLPRSHALNHALGLLHQFIQLRVRAHIQMTKTLKELHEVGHGRIAEDLALAIAAIA